MQDGNLNQTVKKSKSVSMPGYYYGLIAVAAVVIASTISYSAYLKYRVTEVVFPQIEAAHEIKTSVALAHLWAEEVLMNDPDVHAADVMKYYDRASGYVTVMLTGGKVGDRTFVGINDSELENVLKLTKEMIGNCRNITEKRFALKREAAIGTRIDQEFDAAFTGLLETAKKVGDRLYIVINRDKKLFNFIQYALVFSSFLLSFLVGIIVFNFNKRRTGDMLTIEQNNRQLVSINRQLAATEQQLRASNQQLLAGEQQLKASNQQLLASEQQLKAANQQLLASEQQLKAANQQLRASEEALRESEHRYRSLFTDMAEGVALHRMIYDDNGKPVNYEIINVNPQYEKILDISREQVVGKLATEVYGSQKPPYIDVYAGVAETGVPYRFETYYPLMKRYFDISVSSFGQGHFATIFSDISERKLADEKLRQNEARLAILWELSQYKADSVRDLLDYALEKAIRLTGSKIGYIYHYQEENREFILNSWSNEAMKDCSIMEKQTVYHLDKTGIWGEAVRQRKPIIVNAYQSPNPLKRGCPEGHVQISNFMTIPVFNDSRIVAVVGVANKDSGYDQTDVLQLTLLAESAWKLVDLKQAEEERLKLESQLQKLESIGVLAGGIAHDFNNLLTAILANINIISAEVKTDNRISERLLSAEKACLRAQDLTKQLLTFSKGGDPVKKLVSPETIIRDSALFAIRGSNVRCDFIFADNLRAVEVDEGQLVQAINNLVINAIQAMPAGGILKITADNVNLSHEVSRPLADGEYVKITIEDSGIGIPKEYLNKIFDPYFTTKQKGSGLGLAVTYSIIKKHTGYIEVESRPGSGTTFSVYIPASSRTLLSQISPVRQITKGKGRILFMDDEEMVIEVVRAILDQCGYDVMVARDGKDAIEVYKKMKGSEKAIDLVIMDLTIPGGKGGKETMLELLKIDPAVKAIVSSGYSNDSIMADYKRHGFKGVLTKPYKADDLCEAVFSVLNELP